MTALPPAGPMADPTARVLALVFTALGATPLTIAPVTAGMPAASVEFAPANLIVGATVCDRPMFVDVMEQVALERGRDCLLVRTGFFPETLNSVRSDVVLVAGGDTLSIHDLSFYLHADHGLWLVPEADGPCIQVSDLGLGLSMEPPFMTYDEKTEGLSRAARQVVRLVTRGRVR